MRAPNDMPRRPRHRRRRATWGMVGMAAAVIVLLVLWTAFLAWVLHAILVAFGVKIGYWPCLGIIFLAELFLGGGVNRSRS